MTGLASLTAQQRAFLDALAVREGATVTICDLQEALYPDGDACEAGICKVLACRIRKKIAGTSMRIETVRGEGYRLVRVAS